MNLIIYNILFYLFWILCVFGKNNYIYIPILMLCVVWICNNKCVLYSLSYAIFCCIIDSTLTYLGFFEFNQLIIPLWLVVLWLGFGVFLYFFQPFVAKIPYILMIIGGGVGGTLSYFAGMKIGAVIFPKDLYITLCVLFVLWSILTGIYANIVMNKQIKEA